jgi:hypothetical protein
MALDKKRKADSQQSLVDFVPPKRKFIWTIFYWLSCITHLPNPALTCYRQVQRERGSAHGPAVQHPLEAAGRQVHQQRGLLRRY